MAIARRDVRVSVALWWSALLARGDASISSCQGRPCKASKSLKISAGNEPLGKRAPARGGEVRRCRAAAGDVVRPDHTAPCGRCSIKRPGCVCCSCGWERGPSSRTKTGTALHSPGSTVRACASRSASAPEHWHTPHALARFSVESDFITRNNPPHMQRLDVLSGKGGRRSRWRQWPVIRQWSRF